MQAKPTDPEAWARGRIAFAPTVALAVLAGAAVPAAGITPAASAALFLQSTDNTLTSDEQAFGLAGRLPGSRALSREGDDDGLVTFSPCAAAAFGEYGAAGRLPDPGMLCLD